MANITIGKAIDEIAALQKKRDELAAKVSAAEKIINEKKETLLKRVKKSELNGARGKIGAAFVKDEDIPTIEDFAKVWAYARKNNASDLFQRRLGLEAVRTRWEEGKKIPGVGIFRRVVLQVRSTKK